MWVTGAAIAFGIAATSHSALLAINGAVLAAFAWVCAVLTSKRLSAYFRLDSHEDLDEVRDGSLFAPAFTFALAAITCLFFCVTLWVWWEWLRDRYWAEWQPVGREEFHVVTAELQVRHGNYVILTPARPILLDCYRFDRDGTKSKTFDQSCLPDKTKDYLGKTVTILIEGAVEDRYLVRFYEMTSGKDTLFSYDRVLEHQAESFERRRTAGAGGPAQMTLFFVQGLVLIWIKYFRAKKWWIASRSDPADRAEADQ